MYGLPQSTEIKKQLPKKAIYAKFKMPTSQREHFDADISRIDIVALISPSTVPAISVEGMVKEIYVLAVQLKRKDFDVQNIVLLSKLIPHKMVFALHYEDEIQFAIYHTKLISSAWNNVSLSLNGLNLDSVWDNIVKDIGDIKVEEGKTLTEQIKVEENRDKIKAQIISLTKKLNKEKQFNKQMEINAEIKSLRKQLINLI